MPDDFAKYIADIFFASNSQEKKKISYERVAEQIDRQKAETTDSRQIMENGAEIIFDEDK